MAYPYLQDILKEVCGLDVALPLPTFGTLVALAAFTVLGTFYLEVKRMEGAGLLPKKSSAKDFKPLSELAIELWAWTIIGGIVGARLFALSEHWDELIRDPWHTLFARGGLAILGGFLVGAATAFVWLKQKKLAAVSVFDAGAPALILGFAVGRLGCQLSGDGDWGIPADMSLKPEWLPTWFWAQTYSNNILGKAIPLPGVYPTSVYEALMAFLTFLLLWKFRAHRFAAGWTFCLLLVVGGLQRFLIEEIRVNIRYSFLGFEFTQAQWITLSCAIIGMCGLVFTTMRRKSEKRCNA